MATSHLGLKETRAVLRWFGCDCCVGSTLRQPVRLNRKLVMSLPSLRRLRASLNPFSRFDFGLLVGLPHARSWQATESRRETV